MGGRLGPICRASTRAQDRCLLPSPGLTFHIGRLEGSSSSPQPHPSAGGSAAVPLCLASAILRGAVGQVVHAARGPASNSTVQARGVALRSGPGGQAPCGALSRTGRPYHPLPFRLRLPGPPRERAQALEEGWGLLPIWSRAGRRCFCWWGFSRTDGFSRVVCTSLLWTRCRSSIFLTRLRVDMV